MNEVTAILNADNHAAAVALAALPQEIRGFGPVKMAAIERYEEALPEILSAFHNPMPSKKIA